MKDKNGSLKIFLPVMLSFFVMGFVDIVSTSSSYVKKDFFLSNTLSGFLPMMVFIWFGICSIPVGMLVRRIGRKSTVLVSAVVTATGLAIPLINYNFPGMIVAFALLGIGNTILQVSLFPMITNIVESSKVTGTLAFGLFIKSVSSTVGPLLIVAAVFLFDNWKLIFWIYFILVLLSFVWLWVTPIHEERNSNLKQSSISGIFSLLKDRHLLMLFSAIVCIVGFEVALLTIVPKYFVEKGFSLEEGSFANTVYFIARTVGTLLGSWLLIRVAIRPFFVKIMVACLGGILAFTLIDNQIIFFGALIIVGLTFANAFSIVFSQAIQYKPEYTDEISSLMIMGVAGGAIFPFIAGILADATSQRISLMIPVIALIYILSVSLLMKPHKV